MRCIEWADKFPELDAQLLADLVGEYATPVAGLAFTITAHSGKVYSAETGKPPAEIRPYHLDGKRVGFRQERNRLDFMREKDGIHHMLLITPDLTIEAVRK